MSDDGSARPRLWRIMFVPPDTIARETNVAYELVVVNSEAQIAEFEELLVSARLAWVRSGGAIGSHKAIATFAPKSPYETTLQIYSTFYVEEVVARVLQCVGGNSRILAP